MDTSRFRGHFPGSPWIWSIRGALSFALLVTMAGCNGDRSDTGPTTPSPPPLSVTGRWSAVLSGLDAAEANGQLVVTFDHRQLDAGRGLLLGTWSLTSPDLSSSRAGTVSGVVTGAVAMVELVPVPRFQCQQGALDDLLAGVLSLQLTMSADLLAGTVSAHTCGGRFDSLIELRR